MRAFLAATLVLAAANSASPMPSGRVAPVPFPIVRIADRVSQQILTASTEAYRLITAGQLQQAAEILRQGFVLTERRPLIQKVALFDDLAWLYMAQGQFGEAETLLKTLIQTLDSVQGVKGLAASQPLGTLAMLYVRQGRYGDALPLAERAFQGDIRQWGANNAGTAESANRLGVISYHLGNIAAAEKLYLQALQVFQSNPQDNAEDIAQVENNLGDIYIARGQYDDALRSNTQSYQIMLQIFGADDARTLVGQSHVAIDLEQLRRFDEAAVIMQAVLASTQKTYGADNVQTAHALNDVGWVEILRGDTTKAVESFRPALSIYLKNRSAEAHLSASANRGVDEAEVSRTVLGLLEALHPAADKDPANAALSDEAFLALQQLHRGKAETALTQTTVRLAAGDGALARLIRQQQDLAAHRVAVDGSLTSALALPAAQRNPALEAQAHQDLARTDTQIADITAALRSQFPDYGTLADPEALSIAAVQKLLKPNEALVLAIPFGGPNGEGSVTFIVTTGEARWRIGEATGSQLVTGVHTLLCGLDPGHWDDDDTAKFCKDVTGLAEPPAKGEPLPFDAGMAYTVFLALFGDLGPMIQGKSLLVVAPDPLASLPFEVLVTQKPAQDRPKGDEFRHLAWLGRSNAISVLPSVAALQELRAHGQLSEAPLPYIGFGDPTLTGNRSCPRDETVPESCPGEQPGPLRAGLASRGTARFDAFAKASDGQADLDAVRALCPLPETALELRCVAKSLNLADSVIHVGDQATVPAVLGTDLSRYRIVHFATHGLLAGEIQTGAGTVDEPALVLTPPVHQSPGDDGLLRASTISGLKLNADWVVLSACDTAAGSSLGGEAMSGLASAFFYAGARSLLVSHWPVDSEAAVLLTTGAFSALQANPNIGRAEALRRSSMALMDGADPAMTHPSVWAPFSVVGEGGS